MHAPGWLEFIRKLFIERKVDFFWRILKREQELEPSRRSAWLIRYSLTSFFDQEARQCRPRQAFQNPSVPTGPEVMVPCSVECSDKQVSGILVGHANIVTRQSGPIASYH